MSRIRAVFVFGAGASQACGLPPQAALMQNLGHDSAENIVGQYLDRCFPGHREGGVGPPTFEQAYGLVDSLVQERHYIHLGGPTFRNLTTRAALEVLITRRCCDPTDAPRTRDDNPGAWDRYYCPSAVAGSPYARLLHKLEVGRVLGNVCFVNMNYDILLDRSFFCPQWPHNCYYGILFMNQQQGRVGYVGDFSRDVPLFKPHGSLNWLYCSTCENVIMTRTAVFESPLCQDCAALVGSQPTVHHSRAAGARLRTPMLIAPSLAKDFSAKLCSRIQEQMLQCMRSSSIWVFVGYSLPLADLWFLRALIECRVMGGRLESVVVVGAPEGGDGAVRGANDEVFARYKRVFGGRLQAGDLFRSGFHAWVDDDAAVGRIVRHIQGRRWPTAQPGAGEALEGGPAPQAESPAEGGDRWGSEQEPSGR